MNDSSKDAGLCCSNLPNRTTRTTHSVENAATSNQRESMLQLAVARPIVGTLQPFT